MTFKIPLGHILLQFQETIFSFHSKVLIFYHYYSMRQIGNSFTILESVDSTNNYAMAKVHAGLAKHGDTYFSANQTAGKGQRGNTWKSGKEENIALTCIVEPKMISLTDQLQLSIAIALSCYDLVNHYTKSETAIKWPNDIYWRDRKAGGILIENNYKGGDWQYSVVGIGLNVNQTSFLPSLINPVSLKQVTGSTYDLVLLAKELCNNIQGRLELMTGNYDMLGAYNQVLYKKMERVTLKNKDIIFETVVKEVNNIGQLVTFDQQERVINWGEVEWIK